MVGRCMVWVGGWVGWLVEGSGGWGGWVVVFCLFRGMGDGDAEGWMAREGGRERAEVFI